MAFESADATGKDGRRCLIDSGTISRGNCGDAKNASRTDFVLHSLNAGGQFRTRKLGLMPFSSTSPSRANRSMMSRAIDGAALEWTSPRSTVFHVPPFQRALEMTQSVTVPSS